MPARASAVIASSALAVLLVGCGATSRPVAALPGGPGSYVGQGPTVTLLVSWQRSGAMLAGTLREAELTGGPHALVVTVRSERFRGSISGTLVALALMRPLEQTSRLSGVLVAGELDLNGPLAASGAGVRMVPGAGAAYLAAMRRLEARAERVNRRLRRIAGARSRPRLAQREALSVASDLAAAASLVGHVSDHGAPASLLADQRDFGALTARLAVLRSDARQNRGVVCRQANAVIAGVDAVARATLLVEGDAASTHADASAVASVLGQLEDDAALLQAQRTELPSFVPRTAPSEVRVAAAVSGSTSVVAGATTRADVAVAAARRLAARARSAVGPSQRACRHASP